MNLVSKIINNFTLKWNQMLFDIKKRNKFD